MNSLSVSKSRIDIKKHDYKIFFLVAAILFVSFVIFKGNIGVINPKYSELAEINGKNLSYVDLSRFFKDLAFKKGAKYAFQALAIAQLPPNTDFHLLGHTIGDVLYKQQGLNGISLCTQDFRNSCSHSIVVGLFIERGVEALGDIANVCRNAPGGIGAYGMCFHGLGHGILAYTGYDMDKAVDLCKKTGTPELNNIEISECVGGVTMEMVSGVHDAKAWELQKSKYLRTDDPLFPCNQAFIPAIAKSNCFMYLTPHLWEVAGGNLQDPQEKDFAKSFTYCERLTGINEIYKAACYGSFGKEFVGLAMARDIRKISDMKEEQLKKVYEWCTLAGNKDGITSCLQMAVNSLYWGGENKPSATIKFCEVITDSTFKNMCYQHVIGSFKFYNLQHKSKLYGLCRLLPDGYKSECLSN